jgi:diaminohydroxyphosphoribosylaminopyrimidine deaminase / 5-amino-6-(5-phosphoribosylamino)uracil reductase
MISADAWDTDIGYMRQCLALAIKGRGLVSPNPMVGAVIIKNGRVLGRGYHRRFGGPHAEVNAVLDARRRGEPLEGATLYVSLEPCFHQGKTPPCVDLIIAEKFKRVVAAVKDPNPLVNGKSVRTLRQAGIECEINVCRNEAMQLNEPFFGWFTNHRPFVALKTAQTVDGFIARSDGSSKWITNTESRKKVHELRAAYDAILVGAGTAIADDPMLTVRSVKGSNPLRLVLDGQLRLPLEAALVTTANETGTIVYTARTSDKMKRAKISALESRGVIVVQLRADRKRRIPLKDLFADLAELKIMSVLVEGGANVYETFLREKAADLLYEFTSPKQFGAGVPGISKSNAAFHRKRRAHMHFGKDTLDEFMLTYV